MVEEVDKWLIFPSKADCRDIFAMLDMEINENCFDAFGSEFLLPEMISCENPEIIMGCLLIGEGEIQIPDIERIHDDDIDA